MPTREHRSRLRAASIVLIATLAISAIGVALVASIEPSRWRAIEHAAERSGWLRGVPQAGDTNESAEIEQRARAAFDRLAYPASRIPPDWQGQARAYVRRNVRDGVDFNPLAGNPSATRPPNTTSWSPLGPAPIDNAASDGYVAGDRPITRWRSTRPTARWPMPGLPPAACGRPLAAVRPVRPGCRCGRTKTS
ncbi:MAG: hypothetical protein U0Z44_14965 [Kouleothrix sp.]